MPLKDMPRSGRPRMHDARDERLLLRELNKDRELTGQEVQERALGQTRKAHPKTIRLRRCGFQKVKARAIPRLNYVQQFHRRKWAPEFKSYDWSTVALNMPSVVANALIVPQRFG